MVKKASLGFNFFHFCIQIRILEFVLTSERYGLVKKIIVTKIVLRKISAADARFYNIIQNLNKSGTLFFFFFFLSHTW
jgi:hypothetical protein